MPKSLADIVAAIVAGNTHPPRIIFSDDALKDLSQGIFPAEPGPTGPQGPTGPTGPPGAGMVWLGAWSGATFYLEGDGVERNGSSYIAIADNLNSEPPSANWDLVASKGNTGATGAPGDTGETGATGASGPNTVTTSTTTNITGILKGNGSVVSAAVAPTDFVATGDSRLSDARTPLAHTHPESDITSLVSDLAAKAPLASPTFTGTVVIPTPFTLGAVSVLPTGTELNFVDGVTSGIQGQLDGKQPLDTQLTDVAALSYGGNALKTIRVNAGATAFELATASAAVAWGAITGTLADQTDLNSALAGKQPLDTDLTTIAGLTATTDNFMVAASSAWASRTPAQAKTSLALVKGDVGLGNVDNTADASKSVASAATLTTPRTIGGVSFNGSADITVASATGGFTITGGETVLAAGTTTTAPLNIPAGTNETTPEAGDVEYDGTAFYLTADTTSGRTQNNSTHIFRLAANLGTRGAGIADFFDANSAFPTVTNGVYELIWDLYFLKTTAGTATYTITNTQTYTNIVASWLHSVVGGIGATGAAGQAGIVTTTAAAAALPATGSLTTAVNHHVIIRAIAECGTAGNIRLRITQSAGTVTPLRGSTFTARRLFAGNVGIFVA